MINELAIGSLIGVFVLTAVLGAILLPILRRSKVGQQQREFGPKSHLKKSGTPTFGGLMFIPPLFLLGLVLFLLNPDNNLLPLVLYMVAIGLVGFADDYIKVKVRKEGLSPRGKTIPLMLLSALFVMYYLDGAPIEPFIINPFTAQAVQVMGIGKAFYGLFLLIYLYGVINAINLTDGVDGLLSMVTIPVGLGLFATSIILGKLATIQGSGHGAGFVGALCGFLIYNRHTAKVFMMIPAPWPRSPGRRNRYGSGHTVDLIVLRFYLCSGSTFRDYPVTYFRRTGGKRIFRMSPIHHHFELGGWSEWKVCTVFTLVSLAGALVGLLTLGAFIFK